MRIGLLSHQWPGARMGGIGTYTRQCAMALAAAGHEVHVFTLNIPDDLRPSIPPSIHVHETPDLATRILQGTLSAESAAAINAAGEGIYRLAIGKLLCDNLLQVHQQTPFDVIETPEVEALGLPLMLNPPAGFQVPIITHLHCCTAIAYHGNGTPIGPAETLISNLEFATIQLADHICAPTQAVVNATNLFAPAPTPSHISIIPHAYVCDDALFVPPPSPPAPQMMLFIGRIERLKGVITIARALNTVLADHPHAIFRFIGPDTSSAPPHENQSTSSGSMRQYLLSQLSPETSSRVEFLGELPQDQITEQLRTCAFCVQPSFWENFSMVCCEAFAAGRTVIVGKNTGSAELVAEAGLIIDPHSSQELAAAMNRLLGDQDLLNDLSRRAYTRIRQVFSPAVVTRQYEFLYRQVIQNNKAHPPRRNASILPAAITQALIPAQAYLQGQLTPPTLTTTLTPGSRLLSILNQQTQKTGHPTTVLLYGAGKFTARLLTERHLWESAGHRVIGLIDDHPRFQAQPVCYDLPVKSVAALSATPQADPSTPIIILSTDTYQDQFWAQTATLRAQGIQVFRLYE